MGFKAKPYNHSVANKMISNKQCIVTWYVDDVEASHASEDVVTNVIEKVENEFRKLTVSKEKDHRACIILPMHKSEVSNYKGLGKIKKNFGINPT